MQYKNEFDERPDQGGAVKSIFGALDRQTRVQARTPLWALAIVLTLVVFLVSVLWYSYPRELAQRDDIAVPIVRADAGPYKVIPRDPGGMAIPHRDSTVFETLRAENNSDGPRSIENLLDDAEEPLDREELFAGLKTEFRVEGQVIAPAPESEPETDITATVEAPAINPAINEEPETAAVNDEPVETAASAPLPVPVIKPDAAAAEAASRTEPAAGVETYEGGTVGGTHYVQLASLTSHTAATGAWRDLQNKVAVLKPLRHRIQRADLGTRGMYYRVQAGPLSETRAREICAAVKTQLPGGCLVIKD